MNKRVRSKTGDGYIGFGQAILNERKGQRRGEKRRLSDEHIEDWYPENEAPFHGRRYGVERRGEG